MIDFHNSVGATHVMNEDGTYTIFINSRFTKERQEIAYLHEIEHILNEDIESYLSADEIEYIRHEKEVV